MKANNLPPAFPEGNVFLVSVCLSIWAITFECLDINFIFGIVVPFDHIWVMFENQGHMITFTKLIILTFGLQILLLQSII